MINKKGMEAGFLIAIIIVIASFVLIAGVLTKWLSSADEKEAERLCHDSIALRAATTINVNPEKKLTDVISGELTLAPQLCKTIDKKVNGDREEVKKQIAEKIARCWWMFGEGRYEEILKDKNVDLTLLPGLFEFQDYKNNCFNCYTILIDQDEIKGGPISGEELTRYLSTTPYRKVKDTSYLNYVQSSGGPGRVVITAPPGILPRQAYSLSYMPKNKATDEGTFWKGAAQIGVGALALTALGAGAACIFFTVGLCTAVVGPLAPVATAATAIGLQVIAAPVTATAVGALVASGAAYSTYSGYMNIMSAVYGERDVSSIYFGFLEVGEEMCGSKDIAGE